MITVHSGPAGTTSAVLFGPAEVLCSVCKPVRIVRTPVCIHGNPVLEMVACIRNWSEWGWQGSYLKLQQLLLVQV